MSVNLWKQRYCGLVGPVLLWVLVAGWLLVAVLLVLLVAVLVQ